MHLTFLFIYTTSRFFICVFLVIVMLGCSMFLEEGKEKELVFR